MIPISEPVMRRSVPRHQPFPEMDHHQLQCLYLERFHQLVELDASWDPAWSAAERQLLEHALYSTYLDCVRLGLRPVVRAMLDLHTTPR